MNSRNFIDIAKSDEEMHIESSQRLFIFFVHLPVSIIISN